MADAVSIIQAVSTLRSAIDLAKLLRNTDLSLAKAEARNQLADLTVTLADLKMQLAAVQDDLTARDGRIKELEEALEIKATLVRNGDAYYVAGEEGGASGEPICSRCWDTERRQVWLVKHPIRFRDKYCPACQVMYAGDRTRSMS